MGVAKSLLIAIASGFLMLAPAISMATIYKCKVEQSLTWAHGHWEPPYVPPNPEDRSVVEYDFDDETGALVAGTSPDKPEKLERFFCSIRTPPKAFRRANAMSDIISLFRYRSISIHKQSRG